MSNSNRKVYFNIYIEISVGILFFFAWYSIFGMNCGRQSPFVRVLRWAILLKENLKLGLVWTLNSTKYRKCHFLSVFLIKRYFSKIQKFSLPPWPKKVLNHHTRGLYIFYPLFEYHFFVFKEFFRKFCPYVWLVFKSSGL